MADNNNHIPALFLENVSSETTEENLLALFSVFGSVRSTAIFRDSKSHLPLGVACVYFENKSDCDRAERFLKTLFACGQPEVVHGTFPSQISTEKDDKSLQHNDETEAGIARNKNVQEECEDENIVDDLIEFSETNSIADETDLDALMEIFLYQGDGNFPSKTKEIGMGTFGDSKQAVGEREEGKQADKKRGIRQGKMALEVDGHEIVIRMKIDPIECGLDVRDFEPRLTKAGEDDDRRQGAVTELRTNSFSYFALESNSENADHEELGISQEKRGGNEEEPESSLLQNATCWSFKETGGRGKSIEDCNIWERLGKSIFTENGKKIEHDRSTKEESKQENYDSIEEHSSKSKEDSNRIKYNLNRNKEQSNAPMSRKEDKSEDRKAEKDLGKYNEKTGEDSVKPKEETISVKENSSKAKEESSKVDKESNGTKEDFNKSKDHSVKPKEETSRTKEEISKAKEDSSTANKESSGTKEDFNKSKDRSVKPKEKTGRTKEEISTIKEDSSRANKESSGTKEDLNKSKDRSMKPKEETSRTKEEISTIKEDSSTVAKESSGTKEDLSKSKDRSVKSEKEAGRTKEEISKAKEDSSTVNKESSGTKEDFNKNKDCSVKPKEGTSRTKEEISKVKEDSSTVANESSGTKEVFNKSKDHSVKPKEETSRTKEEISKAKEDTSRVNKESSGTKEDFNKSKDCSVKPKEETSSVKENSKNVAENCNDKKEVHNDVMFFDYNQLQAGGNQNNNSSQDERDRVPNSSCTNDPNRDTTNKGDNNNGNVENLGCDTTRPNIRETRKVSADTKRKTLTGRRRNKANLTQVVKSNKHSNDI
eukprot:gene12915-14246_t